MSLPNSAGHNDPMDNQTPTLSKQYRILPILFQIICSGLHCVAYGMTYGFSSPTGPELTGSGKLTESQNAWYSSLPILGSILGSFIATYTTEAWGRRTTLIFVTVPGTLGWGLVSLAFHTNWVGKVLVGLLYTGRFLQGTAGAIAMVVFPVYISESAPKEIRGRFAASYQMLWETGVLLVFALGIPLAGKWLALVPLVLTLTSGALILLLPESPAWLLKNQKDEQARKALVWLKGEDCDIEADVQERLEGILADQNSASRISLKDFRKRSFVMPLLLGLFLASIQLGSGIVVVIPYGIQIIREAGVSVQDGVVSVIAGGLLLVFTCIPFALTDRLGRRFFLILSTSLNCVAMILIGLYFYLTEIKGQEGLVALSLAGIILFFASYSSGLGPIVYIVLGEIFPLRARGAGSGITLIVALTVGFIFTKEFPLMQDVLNNYGVFWLYAGVNLLGTFITAVFLPETKGKSLEEIEEVFRTAQAPSKYSYDTSTSSNVTISTIENYGIQIKSCTMKDI